MNAKQYLNQIRLCERKIDQKKKEISKIRSKITYMSGISYGDKVQSSPENRFEKMMTDVMDKELDINRSIAHYAKVVDEITNQIHQMDNIDYIDILFGRYVDGKSFEQIAIDINLSYHHVCHLHGDALKEFEQKYPSISEI